MLELRNIEKYYNPGTINEMCLFDKFNLTVDKGEFVSVVGSNGSGKTSMLNILCGSIPVDVYKRQVLDLAKKERAAGRQVMIMNMKKNKKFQKEQLAEQGYTDITECYRDSVDNI